MTQVEKGVPPIQPTNELPEGLWAHDGMVFYICLACEQPRALDVDPNEFDPEMAYCGQSPRCLP